MKLELTLAVPDYAVCAETGDIVTHTYTGLGEHLYKLGLMWGMSATEIIERLVHDAVIQEEADENFIDGEYQQPHWAKTPSQTYLH